MQYKYFFVTLYYKFRHNLVDIIANLVLILDGISVNIIANLVLKLDGISVDIIANLVLI